MTSVHQPALRLLWAALLVVSLLAVAAFNRSSTRGAGQGAGDARRVELRFEQSARLLGIDFEHRAPTFDSRLDHIMPQIAAMGAAVAVGDFDRDGWNDLYVVDSGEGSLNRLYRNRGDGTFTDVAAEMGVADVNRPGTGVSTGALWGDFDNDGWEDLFLNKYGRPELFRNEGGNGFARVTEKAALPPWINSHAAVWLDYDRDGRLDLFLSGYWSETIDLWNLETTRIMPESFEYAENGGRSYLLHNLGGGRFEEVAEEVGLTSRRWTLAAAAADLFGTGFPDLYLANDYGVAELYANRDGERFVEIGREAGVGRAPKSGMNAAFGDVFNDGRLSIYRTNISEPGVLVQANDLWVPMSAPGAEPRFEDLASELGIDLGGWSWGAQFGDLDNSGTLDLFLVNGYISAEDRNSYWYDFAEIAVGHSSIIGDARHWPAMQASRATSARESGSTTASGGSARSPKRLGSTTSLTVGRWRSPTSATAARWT